jgi:hypothetical protein
MAELTQEYRYGTGTILLEKDIRRRRDGLDGGTMKFLSESETTFATGTTLGAYGYGGLEIEEIGSTPDGETDWMHTLMVVGIIGSRDARREIGYPKKNKPLTGWDELTDCIITTTPDDYDRGVAHATHTNMVVVESPRENIYGSYWRVTPRYQGLIGSQPTKRMITVNEEVMNPADPIVVTGLTGGWTDPRKAQISLPKIVVVDTSIVIGSSPTATIPGASTPPDPPSIQSLTITGSNLTYRWPHHWKLASINRDELAGTSIALETLTYEYVWPASF